MSIRLRIWLIPVVAVLIFSLGMGATIKISSNTCELLRKTSTAHYPLLQKVQSLLSSVSGTQENYKNAVGINDAGAISLAKQNADDS